MYDSMSQSPAQPFARKKNNNTYLGMVESDPACRNALIHLGRPVSCISALRHCHDYHVIDVEEFGIRYLVMFLIEVASYNNDSVTFSLLTCCGGKGPMKHLITTALCVCVCVCVVGSLVLPSVAHSCRAYVCIKAEYQPFSYYVSPTLC